MRVGILIFAAAAGLASSSFQDFDRRVSDYVRVHKKLEGDLPRLRPTDSPEAITVHQKELAAKIQAARTSARPSEIFTPEISAQFRSLIAHTLRGSRAERVHQSLRHAEPVQLDLRINQPYPEAAPLQSMPPTLLAHLPKLPAELDYRVAGHSLVLRDVAANLIVDFIPDAIP